MLWKKKTEVGLSLDRKKIILERKNILGESQRLKFIETKFPPQNSASTEHVLSVTQCRFLWHCRFHHPIKTTFYKKSKDGTWQKIGVRIP